MGRENFSYSEEDLPVVKPVEGTSEFRVGDWALDREDMDIEYAYNSILAWISWLNYLKNMEQE